MKKIYQYAIAIAYGCFLIGGAVLAKITVAYLFELGLFWYFLGLVAVIAIYVFFKWIGTDDKDKEASLPKTQSIEKLPQKYQLNDELTLLIDGQRVKAEIWEEMNADGQILVKTEVPINGQVVGMFTQEIISHMIIEHNGQPIDVNMH